MDRQKIIIAISVITIITLLGGGYWYLSKKDVLPSLKELFPGEAGVTPTRPGEAVTPPEEEPYTPEPGALLPRLYELHKLPVAGVGFAESGSGSTRTFATRYIERGLGYIFETPLATYRETRIVNETRPRIIEALWGNNGKSVVIRFLDDQNEGVIKSQIINIAAPTISISFERNSSDESPSSDFLKTELVSLPYYIPFMATSGDGSDALFYLENGPEAVVGSVSTFKYFDVSKIFSSSFTEWLPQFPNKNLVTLTTKPSATVPGHLFFIDQRTGSITKIFGGLNGLTTLTSPSGRFVLAGSSLRLSFYDIARKEFRPISLNTFPEKCVWGNKNPSMIYCAVPQMIVAGEYPDQWYQGVIAFSDDLWEIDISTMVFKKIMSPFDFGSPSLDIINPTLSSDDNYLLFMNKLTGNPWVYRVGEEPMVAASSPEI